jgi:hypothetical protein
LKTKQTNENVHLRIYFVLILISLWTTTTLDTFKDESNYLFNLVGNIICMFASSFWIDKITTSDHSFGKNYTMNIQSNLQGHHDLTNLNTNPDIQYED